MSVMTPTVPGQAYTRFLAEQAPSSRSRAEWTEADGPLPAIYLSHGAPPVFDDPHWMSQLFGWSQSLPKPRAILIVSAHWETAPLSLSASEPHTPRVYDFGGFAPVFSTMTYPTPDAGSLARRVASTMSGTDPIHQHASRGLDHGAWVPLKVMYPYADVPVLQMSMPTHDPHRLFNLGRRLRPLRDEGVLVIGSGGSVHNLRALKFDGTTDDWALQFEDWLLETVEGDRLNDLITPDKFPGVFRQAHPTIEHYAPLVFAWSAAGPETKGKRIHHSVSYGNLGMSMYAFDSSSDSFFR